MKEGEIEAALLPLVVGVGSTAVASGAGKSSEADVKLLFRSLGKLFSRRTGKGKKGSGNGKLKRVGYKDVFNALVTTFGSALSSQEDVHRVVLNICRAIVCQAGVDKVAANRYAHLIIIAAVDAAKAIIRRQEVTSSAASAAVDKSVLGVSSVRRAERESEMWVASASARRPAFSPRAAFPEEIAFVREHIERHESIEEKKEEEEEVEDDDDDEGEQKQVSLSSR